MPNLTPLADEVHAALDKGVEPIDLHALVDAIVIARTVAEELAADG